MSFALHSRLLLLKPEAAGSLAGVPGKGQPAALLWTTGPRPALLTVVLQQPTESPWPCHSPSLPGTSPANLKRHSLAHCMLILQALPGLMCCQGQEGDWFPFCPPEMKGEGSRPHTLNWWCDSGLPSLISVSHFPLCSTWTPVVLSEGHKEITGEWALTEYCQWSTEIVSKRGKVLFNKGWQKA